MRIRTKFNILNYKKLKKVIIMVAEFLKFQVGILSSALLFILSQFLAFYGVSFNRAQIDFLSGLRALLQYLKYLKCAVNVILWFYRKQTKTNMLYFSQL